PSNLPRNPRTDSTIIPSTGLISSSLLRAPAAHQFGEPALLAERIRVFAKVAQDLNQALLRRGAPQRAAAPDPQQPLPRQFQKGIVLRWRPRRIPVLDELPDFFAAALGGARPEPREDRVDRQVRHPGVAEQRLRRRQPRRPERPVPRPEIIVLHLQDISQGTG